MNQIEEFNAAIQAKDKKAAVALWEKELICGGAAPAMVVEALVRIQREIDVLKGAQEVSRG